MTDTQIARDQIGRAVLQSRRLSRQGLEERLFARMFRGLVYAQIWEDPAVDLAGLDLAPGARIACIASGGCNMMSYLTAEPAEVTAVDLSPAHVALGRLKIAAAQALPDHAAFYSFFGHADRAENVALYDRYVAPALDADSRNWWETRQGRLPRRIEMFARGFYRYGALGRFIGAMHWVSRLAGVDYRPLLESESLAAQRAFFDREIAPLFDSRVVKFVARRPAALFGLGIPPAQFEKLAADGDGDVVPVLRDRTRKLMCDFPVAENYFLWAACHRGYRDDGTGPVPPYLEARQWAAVRSHAGRARIVNRSLTDHLAEAEAGSLDAFVLLDAQDWMSDTQLTDLWTQIVRTAAPGARVLFRTGGAPDILPGRVPDTLLGRFDYAAERSAALTAADRSAIYGGVHLYRRID